MEDQDLRPQTTSPECDRPRISASGSKRKYKPGDEVYLNEPTSRSLSGPYLISSVTSQGKYVLCLENGDKAKDGKEFEEKVLDKV